MSRLLPVNLDALLHCRGVESERLEFKASWDERATGPQLLRTICAFANDYHNLNGGYVVIGVAERDGRAVLPTSGLSDEEVEAAQRWIRGNCNRLDPPYRPTPPSWPGEPGIPIWRTGISSAPGMRRMPIPARCWNSPRPSCGWRGKRTGNASASRTAGC